MSDLLRTNIYLTARQRAAFAAMASGTGKPASAYIRRALDTYLAAQRRHTVHLSPNPPVLDADGAVHATLTRLLPDERSCGDHDIHRLTWEFTAPGQRGPLTHTLYTGRLVDYPPPGIIVIDTPYYSDLTRLLLALEVLTPAMLTEETADTILETLDLESLVGTPVAYRLTWVPDIFTPNPELEELDRDLFPEAVLEPYVTTEGPDLDTLRLDRSPHTLEGRA